VAGFPGSRLEAVSSGGKSASELRNANKAADLPEGSAVWASLDFWVSPPWRRMTASSEMLRPSCPLGAGRGESPQGAGQEHGLGGSIVIPFVEVCTEIVAFEVGVNVGDREGVLCGLLQCQIGGAVPYWSEPDLLVPAPRKGCCPVASPVHSH
jgi:hypothetical protein